MLIDSVYVAQFIGRELGLGWVHPFLFERVIYIGRKEGRKGRYIYQSVRSV